MAISAVLLGAAAGLKFGSSLLGISSRKRARKAQAALARQQAARIRELARQEAADIRRKGSAMAGRLRARFAGGGVDPTTGTPLQVREDLAAQTELQALRALASGQARAQQIEQQTNATVAQGRRDDLIAGLGAGTTLLTGLSRGFGLSSGPSVFAASGGSSFGAGSS